MLFNGLVWTFLLLCVQGWAQTASNPNSEKPTKAFLQPEIDKLNAFLENPAAAIDQPLQQLLASKIDFALLTTRTFEDYCEAPLQDYKSALSEDQQLLLADICQRQLSKAFRQRLLDDLGTFFKNANINSLYINEYEISEDEGYIGLTAVGPEEGLELGCQLQLIDQKWKIIDFAQNGRYLSAYYRDLFEEILDRGYSLPVLVANLAHREYIVLEDFSDTPPGQLPRDWGTMRQKDKDKPKKYLVNTLNGRHYLAAQDTGNSVIVGKFIHWNPREYPIMTWCWRANALPPGGNERLTHFNDSAAGIFVVFSLNWLGVPKQIKYVWSATLPEGTVDRRKKIFRPWFFVVESGEKNLGKWTFEQVNIYEDYGRVFGGAKPDKRSISIGVLTDANNTKSYAEAFYADFRAWTTKAADEDLIENYCACFEEDQVEAAPTTDHEKSNPLTTPDKTLEIRQ